MSQAPQPADSPAPKGIAGRIAAIFVVSKLTPIAVIASIVLGVFAVWMLPREEEPQINVPIVDVYAGMPGASAAEVENRVTRPMEKLLWEIPDVEYLYSTSSPGSAMVAVRFKVGTRIEAALVRLNQKLQGNLDRIPPGVGLPLAKSRTIDDVPVLALTLHSRTLDHLALRRLAAQVDDAIKSVAQVAETTLIGGTRRMMRVQFDRTALVARGLAITDLVPALQQANRQVQAGSRPFANAEVLLETGTFLRDAADVGAVVVGVFENQPVYLRDVATIADAAEEPAHYVLHGSGTGDLEAAVTLSVAKRPGANAIDVVNSVLAKVDALRGTLLPAEVGISVTRDYGHTAAEKSNELLLHMGIAVFGVAILILIFLGWRESIVVMLAIPSTLALTLFIFYLYGYTLNRITLFALIFSIGILVDDAIVVVENIVRHVRLPESAGKPLARIALEAVDEVGNPTILATWAVIAAILPMAFVGGLMGPYMRPIPIGSTAAMLFSLAIAFTITPWAAIRMLRRHTSAGHAPGADHDAPPGDWFTRLYYRVMGPLLDRARWRWLFLISIALLLLASAGFVLTGAVTIKMLPFDNKSEFQVILNTREGTTLEETTQIAQEMAAAIRSEPEVRDYQIYSGTAAPFNFNGLVRHYYLRRGPNVADIQVNLVGKDQRSHQSHAIAKRIRPAVTAIAKKYGAAVAVAEVPPGPPVLQSIVAEIYGPDETQRIALAREVRRIMGETTGVVDIDWYVEDPQPKVRYVVDKAKAALHGLSEAAIAQTLQLAAQGQSIDLLHLPAEREDVPIHFEFPSSTRSQPESLLALQVRSGRGAPGGGLVPLSELVRVERTTSEPNRYRKNLLPVTYVTADVAGAVESPAYAMYTIDRAIRALDARKYGATEGALPIFHLNLPTDDQTPALKWDGEWHITLEVFRDLGLAFAAVLVLIAMLMVGWFRSYVTPLVVMAAIPFSLVGILPAHWALGAFFTATSMIGFMAGAGIVVRNSIILVDFIELRRSHGLALRDAVIEAGAVRFRPMLLTALAVVVGASVILADPIFQGLAISLMFGEIASLLISRLAVPVLYFMANSRTSAPADPVTS
ncbi:efflux RND transporter permease subunit [Horticoccus sp. 23ND18S-11]|uniref:efflux RND transporter permease subunit n=1 Tax=Horticoccus sp. 23ND18S-11 TaxID=3391832 RepID=UPI0039C9295F